MRKIKANFENKFPELKSIHNLANILITENYYLLGVNFLILSWLAFIPVQTAAANRSFWEQNLINS